MAKIKPKNGRNWKSPVLAAAIFFIALLPIGGQLRSWKRLVETFDKYRRVRDGVEQIDRQITFLALICKGTEDPMSPSVVVNLKEIDSSIERGMALIRTNVVQKNLDWDQVVKVYESKFQSAFLAFRLPGGGDVPVARLQLSDARNKLQSALVGFRLSNQKLVDEDLKSDFLLLVVGCSLSFLLVILGLFFSKGFQKTDGQSRTALVDPLPEEKKPAIDAKTLLKLSELTERSKELESLNQSLKSEVDALNLAVSCVHPLELRPLEVGLEASMKSIRGRCRTTLNKEGRLGLVMDLSDEELSLVLPILKLETQFEELGSEEISPEAVVEEEMKPVILIVDDDRLNRTILRSCLAEMKITVVEAEDGESAWKLLESGVRVDVSLCDINMPGLNGFDLVKRLRKDIRFESLDIIFCTSSTDKEDVVNAAAVGVRQYIVKPFNKEDILRNVQIALDKLLVQKSAALEAQERLQIDAESYYELMAMLGRQVAESVTFARTVLTRGQLRAAWTRINSLRGSSQMVGDSVLAAAILSVERELEGGDIFVITNELEKLEMANRRMGMVAEQSLRRLRYSLPPVTVPVDPVDPVVVPVVVPVNP